MSVVVRPLIWLIRAYQYLISPLLGPSCRFHPSCSDYAAQALRRHGPLAGGLLALWRLLRCNPWGGSGEDPVPDRLPAAFARATRHPPLSGEPN